jgi:hypothetical protein
MAEVIKTIVFAGMETLNTGYPTEIPDNHWADTMNMIRREDGLWENRKGIAQFGSDVGSGVAIHSLRFWKTEAGTRYLTIGTSDDLYSYAESTAYNDGAYTARQDLADAVAWDSAVYRSTIVISNGTNTIRTSTDNITFTERTTSATVIPNKNLEVANDFVSFSGDPGNPNLLYLSGGAPASPWVIDTASTANVDIGNSENITGHLALGEQIVVFKRNRVYAVNLVSLDRTTLDFNSGCESNRAITRTNLNEILFAGRNGIFAISKTQIGSNTYFGTSEGAHIKTLYGNVTDYTSINGVFYPQENYALWNAETTLGQLTFVKNLDFEQQVWTYFYGINSSDWTLYQDSAGDNHLLFADASVDKVWELFKGRNDNGAPILSRLQTKRHDMGMPGRSKHIGFVDIYGYISSTAEWTVELYKDDITTTPFLTATIDSDNVAPDQTFGGLGSSTIGEVSLGGLLPTASGDLEVAPFFKRINVYQDVEKLQILLQNNQADARVIFRAAIIYFTPRPIDQYPNTYIQ